MKLIVALMPGACLLAVTACGGTKPLSASATVTSAATSTAAVNIYAGTGTNALSAEAKKARPLVYVATSSSVRS